MGEVKWFALVFINVARLYLVVIVQRNVCAYVSTVSRPPTGKEKVLLLFLLRASNSSKHTTTQQNQPQSASQYDERPSAEEPQGEVQSVHVERSRKGNDEMGGTTDGRGRGRRGVESPSAR